MYKTITILFISFILLSIQLKASCFEFQIDLDKDLDGLTNESCKDNSKCGLNENLFNYTHSKTELNTINGIKVYTINQNDDSRYNIGYSYGKCVLLNNPSYSKNLKEFLNAFRDLQSDFKLDEVLSTIAKSLPCWITVELRGFADAASVNDDNIKITYEDLVLLNTIVLWKKLPEKDPKAPPAAPTSITPIKDKKKKLETQLSPVSVIADQNSYIIALKNNLIDEDTSIVIRNYSRKYFNFFRKTEAVIIYNLDNTSFITIGIEGMISTMSGINEHGVSVHTIQATNQQHESIIGATPPSILTRMTLESAENAKQANKILKHVKPSLEQAFIIADEKGQFLINTEIQNDNEELMHQFTSPDKIIIYNFSENQDNKNKLSVINYFESLSLKTSIDETINTINSSNSKDMTNDDNNKSIYNAIFDIKDKAIWIQIPEENSNQMMKEFVKIDFNTINNLKDKNKDDIEKDETHE